MLEEADALATWQLHRDPATLTAGPIPATRIADHRKAYLSYEGPVSGDRGTVHVVDAGTYAVLHTDKTRRTIAFDGDVLSGNYMLMCDPAADERWTLAADG